MATITKYYETAAQAQSALQALLNSGLSKQSAAILNLTPTSQADSLEANSASEIITAAMKAGSVLGDHVDIDTQYIDKGYTLLAVVPPFGRSYIVESILEQFKPVQITETQVTDIQPTQRTRHQAAPLSSLLGLKVLSNNSVSPTPIRPVRRSFISCIFGELTGPNFSFSSMFGLPMLSSKADPLSSMFGLSTKSGSRKTGAQWTHSHGFKMLSDHPSPMSALMGVPTLTGNSNTSSHSPLNHRSAVTNKAAPFSDLFGIGTLCEGPSFLSRIFPTQTKSGYSFLGMPNLSNKAAMIPLSTKSGKTGEQWRSSFGFPLLSSNPAPLSSLLGIPPLSRHQGA